MKPTKEDIIRWTLEGALIFVTILFGISMLSNNETMCIHTYNLGSDDGTKLYLEVPCEDLETVEGKFSNYKYYDSDFGRIHIVRTIDGSSKILIDENDIIDWDISTAEKQKEGGE